MQYTTSAPSENDRAAEESEVSLQVLPKTLKVAALHAGYATHSSRHAELLDIELMVESVPPVISYEEKLAGEEHSAAWVEGGR